MVRIQHYAPRRRGRWNQSLGGSHDGHGAIAVPLKMSFSTRPKRLSFPFPRTIVSVPTAKSRRDLVTTSVVGTCFFAMAAMRVPNDALVRMYSVNFVVAQDGSILRWFVLDSGARQSFTVIRHVGIKEQPRGWLVKRCIDGTWVLCCCVHPRIHIRWLNRPATSWRKRGVQRAKSPAAGVDSHAKDDHPPLVDTSLQVLCIACRHMCSTPRLSVVSSHTHVLARRVSLRSCVAPLRRSTAIVVDNCDCFTSSGLFSGGGATVLGNPSLQKILAWFASNKDSAWGPDKSVGAVFFSDIVIFSVVSLCCGVVVLVVLWARWLDRSVFVLKRGGGGVHVLSWT